MVIIMIKFDEMDGEWMVNGWWMEMDSDNLALNTSGYTLDIHWIYTFKFHNLMGEFKL